jgi:hypothetical protein
LFRFLFPTFEKPIDRPRYVNLEPETHEFRGVGIVLLLAASCGVALALWEPSHQVTTPFVTASSSRPASVAAGDTANQETTAAADVTGDVEDDQTAPTVKLSTLCSQRSTARRDCAGVRALKDARLTAPDPAPAAAKKTKPPVVAAKPATADTKPAVEAKPAAAETKPAAAETKPAVAAAAQPANAKAETAPAAQKVSAVTPSETPAAAQPEAPPAAQPQKTASAPKVKRPKPAAEEAPVERLVRVYDQVLPDGRRVPVYRRAGSGAYETGTIVDGEYRPARRANLEPPSERYFGLQ